MMGIHWLDPAYRIFTHLMDSFLGAVPPISGVKIIREVREFPTEAVLEMIVFSKVFL